MTSSHRPGLRFLRASILLALGVVPIAACKGYVIIDCSDAKPEADGLVNCGLVRARPDPTHCELPAAGNPATCNEYDECHADSDCTAGSYGRCNYDGDTGGCGCSYGCESDADCGSAAGGSVCLCGPEGGFCVPGRCNTSADCEDGQSCVLFEEPEVCFGSSHPAFACTTDHDECLSDSQCDGNKSCIYQTDHFACQSTQCMEGRPFFVGSELRTAPLVRSLDWAQAASPEVASLAAETREALAKRWARIGQLEHASVASFARFAMQLLSLGAPPELIEQTTAAMADETLHAKLAFGLASAYAGEPVGPGRLAVSDALSDGEPKAIVTTLVHEGCIGETVAAALAREERWRTADPAVTAVLDRIAEDEERHALLAWRALAWMAEKDEIGPEVAQALAREVASLEREIASRQARSEDETAPIDGTLAASEMASLRRAVLEEVVVPAARALLGRATRTGRQAPREEEEAAAIRAEGACSVPAAC